MVYHSVRASRADVAGAFVTADPMYDFFFQDLAANPDNWEFDRSDLRDAADTGELENGNFVVTDLELIPSLRNQAKEIYNMQVIYEWQRRPVAPHKYIIIRGTSGRRRPTFENVAQV